MTKEELLDIYNTLKRNLSRKPSGEEFHRITRVSRRDVIRGFRSYGEMMEAAGDIPYKFKTTIYTDEEYLKAYGNFIRAHKKRPSQADWMYNDIKPHYASYTKRFKVRWREVSRVFYEYALGKPEWEDVTALMKREGLVVAYGSGKGSPAPPVPRVPSGIIPHVPPALHEFIALAYGNGSPVAFERMCCEAFAMLGYEVRAYGQGKGRVPDGIAEDPINKYAVIYDAKSRKSRYTPGTDDRQVCEYIRSQRKLLTARGFDLVYYLTVSSEFGAIPEAWTFRVQSETGCPPSFITAENLLSLLALKIKHPRTIDTGAMKRLFVNAGEISEKEIKTLL